MTKAFLFLAALQAFAAPPTIEEVPLPALRIEGLAARAHTQGLEVATNVYYVTARRDDVLPKRALLLRCTASQANWDVWDITPNDVSGAPTALDHPGGIQSDGKRLWIPVAESKRGGRSLIRAYLLADLMNGKPPRPDLEFAVEDHIGALAVNVEQNFLLGASWDTEHVYVWDLKGQLSRTLTTRDLKSRGLGFVAGEEGRVGLTVQDWKFFEGRLFASGFHRAQTSRTSRVMIFEKVLEVDGTFAVIDLAPHHGTQLSREGMAIAGGKIHFLPEDL